MGLDQLTLKGYLDPGSGSVEAEYKTMLRKHQISFNKIKLKKGLQEKTSNITWRELNYLKAMCSIPLMFSKDGETLVILYRFMWPALQTQFFSAAKMGSTSGLHMSQDLVTGIM